MNLVRFLLVATLMVAISLKSSNHDTNRYDSIGVEAMGVGPSTAINYLTSVEARAVRFARIIIEIYAFDGPQLSPDQVKSRLDSARLHMLDPTIRRPHFRELYDFVRDFSFISIDHSCELDKLDRRKLMETQHEMHHNLGPYISHYNGIHFKNCARRLDNTIANVIAEKASEGDDFIGQRATITHLRQLISLISVLREEDGYEAQNDDQYYIRLISRGIIEHLSQLGYDIEKSIDISMKDKIDQVVGWITDVFLDECKLIDERYGRYHPIYENIYTYDMNLVLTFRKEVGEVLDQTQICYQIRFNTVNIYPLGKFHDLPTLIGHLHRQNVPQAELMQPIKVEELLDICLFVAQAEIVYGVVNMTLIRELIDLKVVSQIAIENCQSSGYLEAVGLLGQSYDHRPNIINYLVHYKRLQLMMCLPGFESRLLYQTMALNELDDNAFLKEIDELHKIMKKVASEVDPNVKLYKFIPDHIFGLALDSYLMINYRLDSINEHVGEGRNGNLNGIVKDVTQLFRSCAKFHQEMESAGKRYELLSKLDEGSPSSLFHPETLHWMEKYKVCDYILSLPPDFANIIHPDD